MANLLVLVLDDIEKFPEVIEAWEEVGVPGVTILDSVGTRRLQERVQRDDMPLIPSLRSLFSSDEDHNRTLFTVVEDDGILDAAIAAAQKVAGNFKEPNTGILFVVPVSRAWSVPPAKRRRKRSAKSAS